MNGRLSLAPRAVLPSCADDIQFKGLMALLAGIEKALVDIDTGLSMHSSSAKNYNLVKAKEALSTGLADFKRGNSL
jgi:fructose-specific component phosphotransferase system IIB-like protein